MSNIEKSAFRPGLYIGYGGGTVWHIYRNGRASWSAFARDIPDTIVASRLRDINAKLAAMSKAA
jgi:hypothetical protein